MTPEMPDAFIAQMERLMGLRFAPSTLDTHWEGLRDVPLDVLALAVTHAQKACREFPTPAELRGFADRAGKPSAVPVEDRSVDAPTRVLGHLPNGAPVAVSRLWRYYCDDCGDMGWLSFWCGAPGPTRKPWMITGGCSRAFDHAPHEYVQHCHCWESNPELIRKREAQRVYAADRTERRGGRDAA